MRAFFAAPNTIKQDEIAARQLQALNEHRQPRDKPLRLADVKQMFLQMRDHSPVTKVLRPSKKPSVR
jgi:hypothetical protein